MTVEYRLYLARAKNQARTEDELQQQANFLVPWLITGTKTPLEAKGLLRKHTCSLNGA